ncbi:alpha-glucosidase [Sphaerosporella brunnea]|uniref:Alpha-glucosidase n=1 Tax=Sphaerosporella brunnea TaxID=1250544 RepID=A0A5J5F488_9PEZI|nr:alpha-glucosidase [Sphaerosporella brunnea]
MARLGLTPLLLAASLLAASVSADLTLGVSGKSKGYTASNVRTTSSSLTADLKLIGKGCAIYGPDIPSLKLSVNYDTKERLHVKITDADNERYEVPEITLPRPAASSVNAKTADLVFNLKDSPFSFSVSRRSTGEKLFDTAGTSLVFEDQYLQIATVLGDDPYIYGLGEHTENFRLPKNVNRTLWARDAYSVPADSNLYGTHPIYLEHRESGTHGVFLLNSNGMDVNLGVENGMKLQYNVIGGIFDFYFLSGPTPQAVTQQYAAIVGVPALPAYWSLGNHQCRYGYRDWIDIAEVIGNYSDAKIPLETMWTDIDYMDLRRVFTLDPERFPLDKMRMIVDYLHSRGQKYVMMVDPAVAYGNNTAFERGAEMDIFLKKDGGIYKSVVWPGVTAYPDWFNPNTQAYWDKEFAEFFSPETGVDIDGSWIDMNEPSNFCIYPCTDPAAEAKEQGMPPAPPPVRSPPKSIPGFPVTYSKRSIDVEKRNVDAPSMQLYTRADKAGVNYISPPYAIRNAAGALSMKTADTDIVHANGLVEYDVHNLYGTSMSTATYNAMLNRRPGKRPLIITRSTFAGAGHKVGKWLGDNISDWVHYRNSIAGVLNFASIFQVPMVGADVCGFGGNVTDTLCARWMALGAFLPFYRNHNELGSIPQEPYRWPIVASATKKSIAIRYQLLDYFYTALWRQSSTGVSSAINALWFDYPKDKNTWDMDLQYMYGPAVMVAPVTEENSTSVDIYLPQDTWYDWYTYEVVMPGHKTLENIAFDEIPLFIQGGSIIPLRLASDAMTTDEVRSRDFELLIAPDARGNASGELYLDDGDSINPAETLNVQFQYSGGRLNVKTRGTYKATGKVVKVTVLSGRKGKSVKQGGWHLSGKWDIRC